MAQEQSIMDSAEMDDAHSILKLRSFFVNTLIFCFLLFCTLQLPYWAVSDLHDEGAEAAVEYWTAHHYQYGTQIAQNVGPLGFLNYPKLYSGFLTAEKFALNLFLTSLYIVLILRLAKHLPDPIARFAIFLSVALFSSSWVEFSGYINADVRLDLTLLLIAYQLLRSKNFYAVIILTLILALLSLAKGTLLFITPIAVIIISANNVVRRAPLLFFAIPLTYIVGLIFFWTIWGQELAHLPIFLKGTFGIGNDYASGYVDSMFLFENIRLTAFGIGVLLFAIIIIVLKFFYNIKADSTPGIVSRFCHALLEGLILFVVWKHGFVRADGHVMSFFYFTIIACSFFYWLPSSDTAKLGMKHSIVWVGLYALCYGSILAAPSLVNWLGATVIDPPTMVPEFARNAYIIRNASTYLPDLRKRLSDAVVSFQLPVTQKIVGDQAIGYFGLDPAPMLYNHFNYQPMPNTISFTGWSHQSMENDAAFYKDDNSAPPYLLYKQVAIDNRISAQDDALAQLQILAHYDPVLDSAVRNETQARLLLKRRPNRVVILTKPLGEHKIFALNEWIDVPVESTPIRVKIHMQPSFMSHLLRTLYKPSEYTIEYVLENSDAESRKFMPRMAEEGFLIAPLIDSNQAWLAALLESEYTQYLSGDSRYLSRIVRFRISCIHLEIACAEQFDVTFEAVEGLELGRIKTSHAILP